MDDDCVCVANTMRFVKSLYEHGIPAECHLLNTATTACPCALKRWETITPTWPTGSK